MRTEQERDELIDGDPIELYNMLVEAERLALKLQDEIDEIYRDMAGEDI